MEIIRKQVKGLKFSLLSPEKVKKLAAAKIITPELYDVDGYPVDGGLMDLRLGAIDPGVRCRTCGGRLKECFGHPGLIELARSVMHISYIPLVEMFLRSFCQSCGRILLDEESIKKYNIAQRIKKAKDVKKCPYCNNKQEKIKLEKPTTFLRDKKRIFPTEIREILAKISDDDCLLVGANPKTCRPEWAILNLLLVPPVTIRPSITLESGQRSEDDLTHKISDIIRSNQRLWENLNAGAPEVIVEDLWDLLQYHVTTFFDNTVTRIPPARHRSGQPLKTITERIKGKQGRIRHNLAGKRVNYSSRTVISPDPFIKLNEVGVPLEIAKVITVNEAVNSMNIEYMKKLIMNEGYPGANYVLRPDGKRKKITPDLKEEIIEELQPGYFVERHLQEGDIVLFNRHPSLHRPSLMAHFVKILKGKTFRMHPAVTFPYNADFDGDEMNIHSPQTEEARAEAKILLNVNQNLMSPKNNTNLIGCIYDAITGGYMLSLSKLPREDAAQLLYNLGEKSVFDKKSVSGNEVISEILPRIDFSMRSKRCLGKNCKYYDSTKSGEEAYKKCKKGECPNNAYLSIEKGRLLSGAVDKYLFGEEDSLLIGLIDKTIGRESAIETIRKMFKLGTDYLSSKGFSLSLSDFRVNESIVKQSEEILSSTESRINDLLKAYYDGSLEILPGKTKEESREAKILQALNEVRTKIGEIVKKEFPSNNPVNTMIVSGAGGNILNIIQISCCVGQQSLWSRRIGFGYTNRTLSFYKEHDLSPESRGFIYSSFTKGLTPQEFFFGSITGRDGLMDTALRTPKSGYLYRRLANALQDLKVEYDQTIRDASGNIIQFLYGNDGKDVSGLHLDKKISPGEAIGIVTAQSLGEPSTQMALNVFHFAGIQEMQVTLGLPRLIEIFDARKSPSTPAMEIYLEKEFNDEKEAKLIAEKIKEIKLKDIVSEFRVDFANKKVEIILDKEMVRTTHLSINTIANKFEDKTIKARIKDNSIIVDCKNLDFKEIYKRKEKLKEKIVSGIKGISQVLVVKRSKDYVIITAGSNLKEIIEVKGIDIRRTRTNDLFETAEVFGIEAARACIVDEIKKVIEYQGLDIDERHLKLIADTMTFSGEVGGVTRTGIISRKSSVLARASFETPVKQFVNATIKASRDELVSVIENIILNQPVPVGTGLPGLYVKVTGSLAEKNMEKKEKKESSAKKSKENKE
jgi:DNA-directed RNA polymerase subunit A'